MSIYVISAMAPTILTFLMATTLMAAIILIVETYFDHPLWSALRFNWLTCRHDFQNHALLSCQFTICENPQ